MLIYRFFPCSILILDIYLKSEAFFGELPYICLGCDSMNDLELKIKLSNEYDNCFEIVRTMTDLRKCHCWFDRKNVINDEVSVTFTSHGIVMRYSTSKEQIQEKCKYDSVLAVYEMYDGIMLRLSNKRLLFLQAADNRRDTELLMQAVVILGEHCKYIFRKSYLRINKADLLAQIIFRLRPRQGHYDGTGYLNGGLIFLICATVFIATVFVLKPANNGIIPVSEALTLEVTYSHCDPFYQRGHLRYIDLEFDDYEELTVDGCCSNADLIEQLENIPAGTQVHLLVHPKSENVLQIEVAGDILLEFSDAQNRIWRESVSFAVMGLLMYLVAVGLLIGMTRKKL